ncbi:MAG: RNA polymerase sigma factor [Bacteroidota bacterium]
MTDQELITGIVNHDKPVIQFLVNRYHKQVITTAYHFLHDMDDAEDLAQDVCIEILESVSQFKRTSSLSTWIYRITVNKSLNFVRKNKRKQLVRQFETFFHMADGNAGLIIPEPSANDNSYDNKERKQILDNAINSLPENQKTAFILSKYEELSYKEITEIMNLSLASVESLLQRAKQNLQKKLIVQFSEYSNKKYTGANHVDTPA